MRFSITLAGAACPWLEFKVHACFENNDKIFEVCFIVKHIPILFLALAREMLTISWIMHISFVSDKTSGELLHRWAGSIAAE